MGFYEDLAQKYALPGMQMDSGMARDIFLRGLAAQGARGRQRAFAPALPVQGPMAGDVIDQMRMEEFKRQQLMEKIAREEEQRMLENQMAQRKAQLAEDKFGWDQERAVVSDELARERMQTQIDVANTYRAPRSVQGVASRVSNDKMYSNYLDGSASPEEVMLLLQDKVITPSAASTYKPGAGRPPEPPGGLTVGQYMTQLDSIIDPESGASNVERQWAISEKRKFLEVPSKGEIAADLAPEGSPARRIINNREGLADEVGAVGDGADPVTQRIIKHPQGTLIKQYVDMAKSKNSGKEEMVQQMKMAMLSRGQVIDWRAIALAEELYDSE